MDVYEKPMLNVPDAAKYLAIPESTLRAWRSRGTVHSVDPQYRGWPQLPFAGVVEAFVLKRLRELGVPTRHIHETAQTIRERLGDPYGLARPGLGVHGKDILVEVAGNYYRGSDLQQAAAETIRGFQSVITWSGNDPQRLKLANLGGDVILDPRFGWGAPVIETNKVPVEAIIGQYLGGDSMEDIAYDFEMNRDDIERLVRGYLGSVQAAA